MSIRFGVEARVGADGVISNWGDRCLNFARAMAIGAAALVPASTAACSVCIALMLAAWIASGRVVETLRLAMSHIVGKALLLFIVLLVLDVLYSSAPWSERWSSLWSWRKLLWGFIVLGLFADDQWKFRFIKVFLIVASCGLAMSYIGWSGLIPSKPGHFPGVFFTNHATQGMTFALATLCCLEMARIVRPEWGKLCYFGACAFLINIVFTSMSRSSYIAIFCVMLVWCVRTYGRKSLLLATGVVLMLALALVSLSPNLRDRIAMGINEVKTYQTAPDLTSAGVRVVFFKNTLELVKDRPILGYGTGSFAKEYRERFGSAEEGWRGSVTTDPHNQYLFILVENGLIGLTAFLMLLIAGFFVARQPGPYRCVLQGALLAWCVSSLFNSHFRTFPEGHLIWLFFGAMLARYQPTATA
jgi:O-antigen ligase